MGPGTPCGALGPTYGMVGYGMMDMAQTSHLVALAHTDVEQTWDMVVHEHRCKGGTCAHRHGV